jgi:transposase
MGDKKRGKYRRYSPEFKKEAVNLVTGQGYSIAEAARSLGISANMLGRWKQQALEGSAPSGDDKSELARLRKENGRLRMVRELHRQSGRTYGARGTAEDLQDCGIPGALAFDFVAA